MYAPSLCYYWFFQMLVMACALLEIIVLNEPSQHLSWFFLCANIYIVSMGKLRCHSKIIFLDRKHNRVGPVLLFHHILDCIYCYLTISHILFQLIEWSGHWGFIYQQSFVMTIRNVVTFSPINRNYQVIKCQKQSRPLH